MKVSPLLGLTPALPLVVLFSSFSAAPALAQKEAVEPIEASADQLDPDASLVTAYMEHVDFLASPFLEGRLPGTEGMEIAKDYMEYFFERAGLLPGMPESEGAEASWRQPFEFGKRFNSEELSLTLGDGGELTEKDDFSTPGWGGFGTAEGELVFVGYAVEEGSEDFPYEGFPEGTDLTGKIAVMLRYEPMDGEGKSAFGARGWSTAANLNAKLTALTDRGAIGALVINTPRPGRKARSLSHRKSWGNSQAVVPVFSISLEVADKLMAQGGVEGDLDSWVAKANANGVVAPWNASVKMHCAGSVKSTKAENVIGVLPGKGDLADQYVIIGGHLDHLGMGGFGSRDTQANRGKVVHPGADDNASGCAALILLAESLTQAYAELPEDASARTIVFLPFSAEESGLNGAGAYTKDPVYPLEATSLMINFDMIGRIENRQLSASGLSTGEGLVDFVDEIGKRNPLDVDAAAGTMPASDHWRFVQAEVPVAFVSMKNIHNDYHTSRDTADMIQPEDAVWATLFVHDLAYEAAVRPAAFVFHEPEMQGRRSAGGGSTVLFGVNVGGEAEGGGVTLASVNEGGSAGRAGVKSGDVLIQWQGDKVENLAGWRAQLRKLKPGEEVAFQVKRGEETLTMTTKMDGRGGPAAEEPKPEEPVKETKPAKEEPKAENSGPESSDGETKADGEKTPDSGPQGPGPEGKPIKKP